MKKILIVDDSKMWAAFHLELLKQLYGDENEISVCDSAKSALKVIHENINPVFDVIITDMQMESSYLPLEAGEWLIRNIQMIKEYDNVPIILISGANNIEEVAKKLKVECVSKSNLINNNLLFKYFLEKYLG